MRSDVKNIKYVLKKFRSDFVFNTFTGSAFSSLFTLTFTLYNLYLGIRHDALWNYCIAVYYVMLALTKAYTVFAERKTVFSSKDETERLPLRIKVCLFGSVVLLLTDVALIAPISLMVTQQRALDYSAIPAIATAAYTVYKVAVATKKYNTARKQSNMAVMTLKRINFKEAMVSVLALQYILVMTFGSGVDSRMLPVCASSTFFIWTALIVQSLTAVIKTTSLKRCID